MRFGVPSIRAWCAFATLALLAACSAVPPKVTALPYSKSVGILGPRLDLHITHRGRPHYFYNRSVFTKRDVRHPHYAPYYGALLYGGGKYAGGAVQTAPVTYLIFWGWSGPVDATADPDGMAPYMVDFFQAIPGSSWLNTVTQYYQNLGAIAYITNPASQYGGATYDSSAAPTTYTDTDVQSEALKYANSTLGYSANANYIVVTPNGHTINGFNAKNGFCAYHSAVSTTGGLLSYTVFPYIPAAGYGCGAGSVNPSSSNSGILDGVSIVGGHEEAETITDPDAYSGWLDSTGYEIADKCAWYELRNTPLGGGKSYPTQPLWSNAAGSSAACVQTYGAGPSPTPSPTPTRANAVKNPRFESGKLDPWMTCRSQNRLPAAIVTKRKPHAGKFDAYAGTYADGKEPAGSTSVCQLVTVPPGGHLTVWVRGISDDKRAGVFQFGRLYDTSRTLAKTLFKLNANNSSWVKYAVNLSAYGNKSYYLAFGVQGKRNARGRVIGLYIDDVSLAP